MTTGAPVVPSKPKTSGLAITSLTLGIIGPCSLGLLSIVGLILGIVAAKKIKASGGAIGGRGLAIAGIIVSIITLIIGLVIAAIVGASALLGVAGFTAAKDMVGQTVCVNNARQLGVAAQMYANENKDVLPPVDTWPEVLKKGNLLHGDQVFSCPGRGITGRAFAMNAKLNGVRLSQVPRRGETVMFFECSPGAPPSGVASDLPSEPPHTAGWTIAFCDGHTEVVPLNRRDQLIWDPKAE